LLGQAAQRAPVRLAAADADNALLRQRPGDFRMSSDQLGKMRLQRGRARTSFCQAIVRSRLIAALVTMCRK